MPSLTNKLSPRVLWLWVLLTCIHIQARQSRKLIWHQTSRSSIFFVCPRLDWLYLSELEEQNSQESPLQSLYCLNPFISNDFPMLRFVHCVILFNHFELLLHCFHLFVILFCLLEFWRLKNGAVNELEFEFWVYSYRVKPNSISLMNKILHSNSKLWTG